MKFPFVKEATKNLFSKPSTVLYPKVQVEAKPGYRGRISYDAEKCVNCGLCIKVCAPEAITRVKEEVPEGEKVTYTFDLTSCTFCGMCADFCGKKAIELTGDYHMVATDRKELIVSGSKIKAKPKGYPVLGEACVYCTLCAKQCPAGAIEVDRPAKTWKLDKPKCVQCGICVTKCPKKCLEMK